MAWFWKSKKKNTFIPKIGDFISTREYDGTGYKNTLYVRKIDENGYWGEDFIISEDNNMTHIGCDYIFISDIINQIIHPSPFTEEQKQFVLDYLEWCKTATVPRNIYHYKLHLEGRIDWDLTINDKYHYLGNDETKAKEIEQQLIKAIQNREIIQINDINICGGGVVSFKLNSTIY
jgi:hypothetical protein